MQFRHISQISVLTVAAAIGAAAPPGTLAGEVGRLLITFLGLVSASILPTISLILGSMTSNGRSVSAINDLQSELLAAMDALFLLFGFVGIAVFALLSLAIAPPELITWIPYATIILPRLGQAIVALTSVMIVLRAGQIPGILRRSLEIRHRIAADEARRKTMEKAPSSMETKASFAAHPDFGKSVDVSAIQARDPH